MLYKANSHQLKPPYWKQPIDTCSICKGSLVCKDRWRVKIYYKSKRLGLIHVKTLHLCRSCLMKLLDNKQLKRKFKIKYDKMPILGRCY